MKGKATLAEEFSRPEMAAMGVDLPHRAVVDALNLKFPLRPYQREALRRLELYMSRLSEGEHPDQLLFHMATGSGKTLIMGGAILQLYRRGYRRFVFLVDSTNIIEKTKDNFLNPQSQKFLFRSPLYLDDKRVSIAETANFQAIDPHGVNILFTTVQGLHSQLSTPRENMLTIEDFALHPTVFISDEAHHINAATKKSSHTHKNPKPTHARTWEESVDRVFRSHARNVLLEFTATAPLDHPQVAKKYRDKIIMDYSLKQFRRDGYSKEIKVLQSDLPPFDRALQAAVLSVYRQRLFADHGVAAKPVVMFKSRTIAESRRFFEDFVGGLPGCENTLMHLKNSAKGDRVAEAFADFERRGMSLADVAVELSDAFSVEKLLVIDSKSDGNAHQKVVNNLEAPGSPYRGIFAVDMLNEGWDVLNLFDIVRLYDVGGGSGKMRKSTMAEAQLIGRGARYFPFRIAENQIADRRKFDANPDHPLRAVEELVYHASHNPSYVAELGKALTRIGIRPEEGERKATHRFTESRAKRRAKALAGCVEVEIFKNRRRWEDVFESAGKSVAAEIRTTRISAVDIDRAVWKKAFRVRRRFWYDELKLRFPRVPSTEEFMRGEQYLGGVDILLRSDMDFWEMDVDTRLEVALGVLDKIVES